MSLLLRPKTIIEDSGKISLSLVQRKRNIAVFDGLVKKLAQISKICENTMKRSIILTCHTDFAPIFTYFVCGDCNFTWSTTMHMKCFHILLTNLQKHLKKILLSPWSETFSFSGNFVWIYFEDKNVIFLSISGGWSIKGANFHVNCGNSCKITALTDKFCGNENKKIS
jgi:hypothetical protein